MKSLVYEGMSTPWGAVDMVCMIAPGIGQVTTAGHGGIKLSYQNNQKIPVSVRTRGGWYEEDCEWSIPYVVLADQINQPIQDAMSTLRTWYPDFYEQFTGEAIRPGDSYVRDKQAFRQDNRNNWVVISAFGNWHEKVPPGLVGVCCKLGGDRDTSDERRFLVPEGEYKLRGEFGFVVNPSAHAPWGGP